MATLPVIRKHSSSGRAHSIDVASMSDATGGHLADIQPIGDRECQATHAVALAFARIASQRYPGTSWLPVKRSRGNDGLVVPAGKVVRLLPSPADVDTSARIGNPTAPAAHERAPYEYSADPRA